MQYYTAIAEQFITKGKVIEAGEFGNGNINDTYLVITDTNEEQCFVLQRINTHVFRQPTHILRNIICSAPCFNTI